LSFDGSEAASYCFNFKHLTEVAALLTGSEEFRSGFAVITGSELVAFAGFGYVRIVTGVSQRFGQNLDFLW
jgi:hypothetical protein